MKINFIKIVIYTIFLVSAASISSPTLAYGECTEYGIMATYDYLTDSCKCMSGYAFKNDFLGNPVCTSLNQICMDELGYNASYNYLSNSCKCGYGYVIDGGRCTDGDSVCRSEHGYYSSYDNLSNRCECDDGYTLNDYNQCVKKQNNVYFYVKELDTNNRKAIIKSQYDYSYYLVSYGIGCFSSSFSRYVNNQIVVNLGTDYDLDVWDKIVLQDDNETCDITQKERVDSSATLEPVESDSSGSVNYGNYSVLVDSYCKSTYGIGAIGIGGLCYCGIGYQWSADQNLCIENAVSCPVNSSLVSDACACNQGYVYHPLVSSCVDYNASCRLTYGENSFGNSDFCYCETGYEFNLEKTSCILKPYESVVPTPTPRNETNVSVDQSMDEWISGQIDAQLAIDNALVSRVLGRILLQVESHGEAWYLDPISKKRFYMKDGNTAYQMLRSFGLGISEVDYNKMVSGNSVLKDKLKGRILLRVQAKGEAYYINPVDLNMHYLQDGAAAYQIMRKISLGISNSTLNRIPIQRFVPLK